MSNSKKKIDKEFRKLTEQEMLKIDLFQEKRKNARGIVDRTDRDIINHNLQIDLLKARINTEVETINKLKAIKHMENGNYIRSESEYRDYVGVLTKDLGLEEGATWGWNPDTGEVKVEEKEEKKEPK